MTDSIKMIAFDLFGVILTEGHLISNALIRLLPAHIEKAQVKFLYEKLNLGQIHEDEFWSSLGLADSIRIRGKFLTSFTLDPEYKKVVESLSSEYRLSILSNLPAAWADELMVRFKFGQHFLPCLFSGHARCKKPNAEIYHKLIKLSKLRAEQIAFIDDRLENLHSAHELGFGTVHYHRQDALHPYKADYTIRQLGELPALFRT